MARACLERACAGEGRLVLFSGEPGIGKSRLAEEVALEAAARGAVVAWGRCWEAGGAPAYWPWIQVFRELRMDQDPFAGAAAHLAAFAPEARFAVFDTAVRSLRSLAADRPLVLVLDDLHAADAPSLLLLLLLARELSRSPILVVGAYRDAELRLTPDTAPLLAKVAREADVIPLECLGPEDVSAWLREATADSDAERAARLFRVTEGHPLFVVEALRLGQAFEAQAAWSFGPGAVLDERLSRLSARTLAVLEVAAVFGREFSPALLAETAEIDPDEVHEALNEAVATNIVMPSADERFRFSHVLLRDKLYVDLRPTAREALHFRAGSTLLRRGEAPEAAVHHLFEGQSAGTPARVAEVGLAAAKASLSRLAFEDAVQLGRRALGLPGADEFPEVLRGELEVIIAEGLIRLGDSAEGKALCARAAARAELGGAWELQARAALVYGTELASGTIDPQMIALLRKALAAIETGDSSLRARLMTRLAAALTPPESVDDNPEILSLMHDAMNMARRLDDPDALLYVLQFSATVGLLVAESERFRMLEETLALARALGQPLVVLHTLPAYITALLALGRRADAEAELPAYTELIGESRQPVHRTRYLIVNALLLALSGDFAEADRLGDEARLLAQSTGSRAAFFLLLTHRLSLAILRKQPGLIAGDADALLNLFASMSGAIPYVAWFLAGTGKTAQAVERLSNVSLEPAPIAPARLWEILGVAETCVLLGDKALGARVYPELVRAADRMFWNTAPGAIIGPSARVLGDLARLIGRFPDAARHYDEASAFCEKLESPPLLESCRTARDGLLVELPAAEAASAPAGRADARAELQLRREGELWMLTTHAGTTLRLKHGKGFGYLQYLLDRPGTDVYVLELAGIEQRAGDAGPVLDARAKAEYRQRLSALRDELEEAERFGDPTRATRAREELDTIAEQLAGAVGLGGRDRRAASDVERARINVQRRLKDAIERIAAVDAALGRYLSRAVKTGTSCSYQVL